MKLSDVSEIRDAIVAELSTSTAGIKVRVVGVELNGTRCLIELDPTDAVLDETLEDSRAWWPKGGAKVLAVLPEEHAVLLRDLNAPPPGPGDFLWLYPPPYLETLKAWWENESAGQRSETWFREGVLENAFDSSLVPSRPAFTSLRVRQREAYSLLGWRLGFLRGPPGTGKTFTIGSVLAQALLDGPDQRILFLASTNNAVDLGLIAIDAALAMVSTPSAERARRSCCRVGTRYLASRYAGRDHLLPARDPGLLERLAELEARAPEKTDHAAYETWRAELDEVRQKLKVDLKTILDSSRLVGMTTARALNALEELSGLPNFDAVVFDEGSQIPLVTALTLAPLARRTLVAGDPEQLAPIVRSESPLVKKWLGRSLFDFRLEATSSPGADCLLEEQSRMAEPICRVVSNVFYEKRLRVADREALDPHWIKQRTLPSVSILGTGAVHLANIDGNAAWRRGLVRDASAERVRDVVAALLQSGTSPQDVLVLTPFRAQRSKVRALLKKVPHGSRINVSTVHRAQGTEAHTVIFDVVDGQSKLLRGDAGRRLINVALSRAKARLVVILSAGDRANPTLAQVAHLIEESDTSDVPITIDDLRATPPKKRAGLRVRVGRKTGRFVRFTEGETKIVIVDDESGREIALLLSVAVSVRAHTAGEDTSPIELRELMSVSGALGATRTRSGPLIGFSFASEHRNNADRFVVTVADEEIKRIEQKPSATVVWLLHKPFYARRGEKSPQNGEWR